MKKDYNAKKLRLIGSLIFLIGVLLFVVAFALSGWDIRKISTRPPYTQKEYSYQMPGSEIVLLDDNTPITVELSPDNKVHLSCFESEKEWYEVSESGTELNIEKKNNFSWTDYFMVMDLGVRDLVLQIPKDYKGDLELKTSNGSIRLADLAVNQLTLKNSNASIHVEDLSAESLKLSTSNGSVKLSSLEAGPVDVSTSNSSVSFKDVDAGAIDASSSNGSLKFEQVNAETLNGETSNSWIYAQDVYSTGELWLKTSNNSIELDKLDSASSIDLNSSNGRIFGTIKGKMSDFSIKSDTSNGENNLPKDNQEGTKKLKVKTSNNSIQIEFEQ